MKSVITALVLCALLPACASQANLSENPPLGADIVELPIDVSGAYPIIEVSLNGTGPYKIVLDTGAPERGIFSARVAEALALEPVGETTLGSPLGGTPVPADVYEVATFEAAGARANNVGFSVIRGPARRDGSDGVIGPAVFGDTVVTMDFQTNTLRVGGTLPEDVTWIDFGDSAPILDATVKIGDRSFPAHIDTGAPHVMAFPEALADELPLLGPVQVVGRARTIDKEFDILAAPMKAEASIGDAVIPMNNAEFGPLPVVNVGMGAMRGLVLTIDWPNKRYAIEGQAVTPRIRRKAVKPSET